MMKLQNSDAASVFGDAFLPFCLRHSGLWPRCCLPGSILKHVTVYSSWTRSDHIQQGLQQCGFMHRSRLDWLLASHWYPRWMGKLSTFMPLMSSRDTRVLILRSVFRGDHTLTQSQSDWQAAPLCSPVTQTSAPTMAEIPPCLFG